MGLYRVTKFKSSVCPVFTDKELTIISLHIYFEDKMIDFFSATYTLFMVICSYKKRF